MEMQQFDDTDAETMKKWVKSKQGEKEKEKFITTQPNNTFTHTHNPIQLKEFSEQQISTQPKPYSKPFPTITL